MGLRRPPAHGPQTAGLAALRSCGVVVIDVSAARDGRQLHAALSQALGFPAFCGMNWDAFWDAITGLVEMAGARGPVAVARYGRCPR
ncbi:barstar family protein [Streptomyces sp. NPDC002659]|uniref:barstar family protein n=1 Tax=Streptomyces sp. NPDC002659 TaxID=3364656 RepID=UPI0036A9E8A5